MNVLNGHLCQSENVAISAATSSNQLDEWSYVCPKPWTSLSANTNYCHCDTTKIKRQIHDKKTSSDIIIFSLHTKYTLAKGSDK